MARFFACALASAKTLGSLKAAAKAIPSLISTPVSLTDSINDRPYSVAALPAPVANPPTIRDSNGIAKPLVAKATPPATARVGK